MTTLNVTLGASEKAWLDNRATLEGISKAAVVRAAIIAYQTLESSKEVPTNG